MFYRLQSHCWYKILYFIKYSFNMFILGMKKIFECQIININNTYLNVKIEDILTILSHCKGYIIEYCKRNLLDELKQQHFINKILEKPSILRCRLHWKYNMPWTTCFQRCRKLIQCWLFCTWFSWFHARCKSHIWPTINILAFDIFNVGYLFFGRNT